MMSMSRVIRYAAGLAVVLAMSAQVAQAAPMEVPEQVLITGSLIHGTAAVGVPVTNLSTQDFAQTGSLTTADLFRTIPAANVTPGPVGTLANNNIGKQTRVNIRNLDPNDGTRSLMMVDGYRFPPAIIQQAIWLYFRFTLSFRDVEDLLAERGIMVSYETVRRWVNHFGPLIAADLRKRRPKPHTTWHLDEGAPRRREGGAMS